MQTLLTTAGSHPRNSFRLWRDAIYDRIGPVEMTQIGGGPFEARIEAADVGSLMFNRLTHSAIRIKKTAETIRRRDAFDKLDVAILLSGTVSVDYDDRALIHKEGDLVVLDHRPTIIVAQATHHSLILEVPRDRIEGMLGSPRLYAGLTVGACLAGTSLVRTFFDELIRVHPQLDPATTERMSAIGVDLLVASIAARLAREVPKPLHGTVVLQRAKAYIEANLGDPNLDPPQLAAAMGVSLRRLQELFHEHGRHVSDWIWQRRLATAAARLADPGYRHLPIGSLAHGCGFSTQAHFARRFRDRYGMTPSEWRGGSSRIDDSR